MKKDFIIFLIIISVVAVLAANVKIQSVDDYYSTNLGVINEDSETVFLSITCEAVLENINKLEPGYEKGLPQDGIILPLTEFVLVKGDTVYSVLNRVARHYKIQAVYDYHQLGVYVSSINGLDEACCGEMSGWLYCVNGIESGYACSAHKLADGDVVVWRFTCNGN